MYQLSQVDDSSCEAVARSFILHLKSLLIVSFAPADIP
jgi:hypothetical protein